MEKIAGTLPGGVGELISTRGRKYKELGLAGQRLSDDEWYRLIEKEPRLLRRPILWDGQRAQARDLGSTNGSKLNGAPLSKAALQADSVIEIGRTRIVFRLLPQSSTPDPFDGPDVRGGSW